MGLLCHFFVLGILNVSLGYALAVFLGYGPESLKEAWIALGLDRWQVGIAHEQRAVVSAESFPTAPSELEALLDADAGAQIEVEPYDEPYDEDVAQLLRPAGPDIWDLNEKYVETSILKLNIAMMRSGARATEIDTRLRAIRGHADPGTVQRCLDELKTDCELYLAEQSEAAERLHQRIGELGELKWLGEEIEMANMEQAAQIETTLSNLAHMDFRSDLEAAVTRLLAEIGHLRVARHKLRDSQEKAFLVIARYENRMDKIERQLFNDPLTKLRNRIGLEALLWEWWQQNRQQSRPMTAALYDLDGFGKINELHGPLIGDRILHRLAEFIQQNLAENDLVARFAGQQFVVLICDIGPRVATRNAEFIRQSLERVTFQHEGTEISLTACAAITEIKPDDVYDKVLDRLEETMKQAKQAGPNRMFVHDGRRAEPLETPPLGAKYVEIPI